MNNLFRLLLLAGLCCLSACASDPLDVDVSGIQVPQLTITRFDQKVMAADSTQPALVRAQLRKQYGAFSDAFFNNIVCSTADSLQCLAETRRFLGDKDLTKVRNECVAKLSDLSAVEHDITEASRYFRYHFPKRQLPKKIYAVMSGFSYNFMQTEGEFGIGLEFYLGPNNAWYDALQWPMFKRVHYRPEYMAVGFVRSWLLNEFPYEPEKDDAMNRMIYEGKLLYLSKALLRQTPDTLLTGFSAQQLAWCEASEGSMWAAMIEQKLLYSERPEDINHLTDEAPFTAGFPRESPGGAGRWIGLRIVEAYMKQVPTTTLEQLMQLNSAQLLLTRAKYKPKL